MQETRVDATQHVLRFPGENMSENFIERFNRERGEDARDGFQRIQAGDGAFSTQTLFLCLSPGCGAVVWSKPEHRVNCTFP
jgi:hypothetical protein